jgi:hypothetical protein
MNIASRLSGDKQPALQENASTKTFPFIEVFRDQCELHARLHAQGLLSKPTAVDHLQWLAETWHLVELHGQDAIQAMMARPFARIRYSLVSDDAPDPVRPNIEPKPPRRSYSTPKSTVDAFWHVARNENTEYLTKWLRDRPLDAPHLQKLWKQKCAA